MFASLTAKLIAVAVALTTIVAIVGTFSHERYTAGYDAAIEVMTKKLNDERDIAQAMLNASRAETEKEHQRAVTNLTKLATTYETKAQNDKAINDARIADLHSGNVRLRVALAAASSGAGSVRDPAAPASGSDGPPTGELSRDAAERLDRSRALADEIVGQLNLAQDTIEQYYRTCGPKVAAQ